MTYTVRHPRLAGVTAVVEDLDRALAAGWVHDEPERVTEPVDESGDESGDFDVDLDEWEPQPEVDPADRLVGEGRALPKRSRKK